MLFRCIIICIIATIDLIPAEFWFVLWKAFNTFLLEVEISIDIVLL